MDAKTSILAAAEVLFLEQGYKKTTVRQIAERAGANLGLIPYYFKNKENIARVIYDKIIANVLQVEELDSYEIQNSIERLYLSYIIIHRRMIAMPGAYRFYLELIQADVVAVEPASYSAPLVWDIVEEYGLTVSETEINAYNRMLKGAERSLTTQSMEQDISETYMEINRLLALSMALLLGVDRETILHSLDRCDRQLRPGP